MKKTLIFLAAALMVAPIVKAQKVTVELSEEQLKPIRQQIINQHEDNRANNMDWANFRRYAKANEEVTAKPKAVLMGNSITEGWVEFDAEWLKSHNLVGRGISGQVSGQMLLRFRPDVLNLKPEYVAIMCGINDIARNQGIITVEHVLDNIKSMVQLAKANRIKPIVCSVTPAANIGWRPQVKDTPEQVAKLNKLIQQMCAEEKVPYLDYFSLLVDTDGISLKKEYARDSVHPNLAGYKVMEEALAKALGIKN